MKINFSLSFTTSKLLAYLIFASGSILSGYLKDSNVFISAITIAALLSGTKAVTQAFGKQKQE